MNVKKAIALSIGIVSLCAMPLFPEGNLRPPASAEDLIGIERAAILRKQSAPLTEIQLKNPQLALMPNHENIRLLANNIRQNLQPSIIVETLYLYSKPQSAAETGGWTEAQRTKLYNQALGISTLAGIQYFSASRNTMRTFYETSNIIDGPDTKKPVPDPSFTVLPAALTLYARQKDATFGDNIYRYDYYSYSDALVFVQENLTAMNAGIIPALGKNKLRSFVAVLDAGDTLLIYAISMAKAVSLPGMDNRIGNSFTNRAEAILKWFTNRAEQALK